MDIKDLNKSQLLLLAILLSFITSIATGITTVTLMEQAPAAVTVPMNRVIRQTVENIQQVEGKTTVQTVVVKEEDLVVDAISKNKSSAFTITKEVRTGGNLIEVSAGKGFIVSDKKIIVADSMHVQSRGNYFVQNESGKFEATFLSVDEDNGVSFLQVGDPVDEAKTLAYTLPTKGDMTKMKIGQKIIVLGENISTTIYDGENIKVSPLLGNAGAMVLNLEGEVLGISLYNEAKTFVPMSVIESGAALAL